MTMKYIKHELDNFDYNKNYYIPSEHKWCFLKDNDKAKKYIENRDKITKPIIGIVQSNPEKTGQIGTML